MAEPVSVLRLGSSLDFTGDLAHGSRAEDLRTRLQKLCERLDIACELPPHAPDAFDPALRLSDRVHFNAKAHARMGEIDARAMLSAWKRGGTAR